MERAVVIVLAVVGILAVAGACFFAFARRKDDHLRSVRLAVLAAVISFVVATAGFVAFTHRHYAGAWHRESSPVGTHAGIHVVFTSQTYDPQTALFSLQGIVRGSEPEQQLWVVFHGARRDRFFPAPAPCTISPEGNFSCQQNIAGTLNPGVVDTKGWIVTVAPEAADVFRQYTSGSAGTAGLRRLPDGVTVISQISVGSW